MISADAIARARLSLEGLAVGDTFGERFFGVPAEALERILARDLPPAPWSYTGDTEMALSVYETLTANGTIDQRSLAIRFASRMEPGRGYGAGAYKILTGIKNGGNWRVLSRGAFGGTGSFGNGAAMRVGPLGGFFADSELERVSKEARLSAEVTHAHDEGVAGAVSVAVACALAWRHRGDAGPLGRDWLVSVRDNTPKGDTRDGIDEALGLDRKRTRTGGLALKESNSHRGSGGGRHKSAVREPPQRRNCPLLADSSPRRAPNPTRTNT